MKIELLQALPQDELLKILERAGRTCYKSESRIKDGSAEKFIKMLIINGHESVLEHGVISVILTTDRGVANELVRHRIAAYSQESTRYCNYSKGIKIEKPLEMTAEQERIFDRCIKTIGIAYNDLLDAGCTTDQARDVLPTCTETTLVATWNIREWRHIFKMRTSNFAHPKCRKLMRSCLDVLKVNYPVLFGDINYD